MMTEIKSRALRLGVQLRYKTGGIPVMIDRRKDDDTGWWLTDNQGGLADSAVESGDWSLVKAEHYAVVRCACEAEPEDRLSDLEACDWLLAHIALGRGGDDTVSKETGA